MWQRFRRAMRSMFGWMVSAAEDPELILEQNIRDLNDQVPKMNESIAMVKANVTLLEKENQKYKNDSVDLVYTRGGTRAVVTLRPVADDPS